MSKWSGGEKVTISLLLFCMLARLRAGEGHEFRAGLFVIQYAAWRWVLLHYLAIPKALLSVSSVSFPGILEERELAVQLAFDENSLTTIKLGGR